MSVLAALTQLLGMLGAEYGTHCYAELNLLPCRAGLRRTMGSNPHVKEVRGLGLLVGVQLDVSAGKLVEAARAAGVLIITAGKGDVVRLVPPLVATDEEIDKVCEVLGRLIHEVQL